MYCRYILEAVVKTSFLQVAELPDGLAVAKAERVHQISAELNLNLQKCGLGSNGPLVMLRVRGGLSALLEWVPFLVSNHCIAHHLALACGQATNYLKRFKDLPIFTMKRQLYVWLD